MDVDAIRSRFIQENLRRALQEPDKERAARALRAFRNYFQWFESRLPDFEKTSDRGPTRKPGSRSSVVSFPRRPCPTLLDANRIGHNL